MFWIKDGISYAINLAKGDVRENENTYTIYGVRWGVLVTGLVAIPVRKEADARSNTDSERNKGKQKILAGGV